MHWQSDRTNRHKSHNRQHAQFGENVVLNRIVRLLESPEGVVPDRFSQFHFNERTCAAMLIAAILLVVVLVTVTVYDITQRRHAILRNFPIVGHLRYLLEAIGPELRQYIVTGNNDERPFSRAQRRWVYASSKLSNNYFGFGTDQDLELAPHSLIIKHSPFPLLDPESGDSNFDPQYRVPCGKVLGSHRQRRGAFRPSSVINISAMSFGSLSGRAVEAFNRGAKLAGCMHNTGEGGVSPYHKQGGDLIWQLGTGYFGCRDEQGRFSIERFREVIDEFPVRAIEIKLS